MTDVLGPCPVCGNTDKKKPVMDNGDSDHWHSARAVSTLGGDVMQCVCGFACTEDHWSLLRRKMTREEADAMRKETWDARTDMEHAVLHGRGKAYATAITRYTASMRVIVDALVGDKP
jgi:hypothetical protein